MDTTSLNHPADNNSVYLHQELGKEKLSQLGNTCWYVGIDLAPNDGLETGLTVLDKKKQVMRMDKINTNGQILTMIESLGAPENCIIVLDVPKSLSIPSKWRQLEVKYFPLRLENDHDIEPTDRFSPRAWEVYKLLSEQGYHAFLSFNHLAKQRYGLTIPFKTRSPQGCKALQAIIDHQLKLVNMPTNLAPSSVLEASISAYIAWTIYSGTYGQHFKLFTDRYERLMVEPLETIKEAPKYRRRRRFYRRR